MHWLSAFNVADPKGVKSCPVCCTQSSHAAQGGVVCGSRVGALTGGPTFALQTKARGRAQIFESDGAVGVPSPPYADAKCNRQVPRRLVPRTTRLPERTKRLT